ncbi:type II/IV secretion system protein [Patescibacteria group bacterium]|nr:MAG: type II/IV secretion system protein [Patescibacteria group bacterium]
MHLPPRILKNIIVHTGLVTDDEYHKLEEEAARRGTLIANLLVEKEIVPEKYLIEFLASSLRIPVVDLKKNELKKEIVGLIPENMAENLRAIVYAREKDKKGDECFRVAMEDPLNIQAISFLEKKLGGQIIAHLITPTNFKSALKFYRVDISSEFNKIIQENIEKAAGESGGVATREQLAESIPVIAIFDTILKYAAASNASDIHIEPEPKQVLVRYRIDGILRDIIDLPVAVASALIARIKVMSRMAIDEHSKPQDGRFKFQYEDQSVSCRVSVMPVFYGEKAVIRLLVSSGRVFGLNELGYSEYNQKIIQENLSTTHGMILSTGPTGSGKTTTLYALLHLLNNPDVNICTIEDPIEYDIPRINQTQVNIKAGITFANGLRAFLRQNPDIMMVGEIRDGETADIAIQSALTGHLVLSTIHTNDAPSTVARLIDMGAEPFLLSSTLNLIIAQRLCRRICLHCIASIPIPKDTAELIKKQLRLVNPDNEPAAPKLIFKGQGCKQCSGAGYSGQIGIFEVLDITAEIRELITTNASADKIRVAAIKNGMKTMFEDGMVKVEAGMTTVEEVLKAIRE